MTREQMETSLTTIMTLFSAAVLASFWLGMKWFWMLI
jgi:hypothetical protein